MMDCAERAGKALAYWLSDLQRLHDKREEMPIKEKKELALDVRKTP